jgi:hypothetical protein
LLLAIPISYSKVVRKERKVAKLHKKEKEEKKGGIGGIEPPNAGLAGNRTPDHSHIHAATCRKFELQMLREYYTTKPQARRST